MPIPKPRTDEKQNDYISRCVSSISGEYDQEQAVAICFNTWREDKAEKCAKEIVKLFDMRKE